MMVVYHDNVCGEVFVEAKRVEIRRGVGNRVVSVAVFVTNNDREEEPHIVCNGEKLEIVNYNGGSKFIHT